MNAYGESMNSIYIMIGAVILLAGLLYAESKSKSRLILSFKTPLSALFIVTCLLQPRPDLTYFYLILIGLVLGLIGDVCLAIPGDKSFRVGLVSFLLGHVLYVVAFAGLAKSKDWFMISDLVIIGISIAVFFWLRPKLGNMVRPVAAYVVVITAMVIAAWAAFQNLLVPRMGAWVMLIGAVAFYLSDLFVARDRFVKNEFLNRYLGLPLYYSGQFLIAFSVGLIAW